MGLFCVVMLCGALGFWLSDEYQVPQWLMWSMLVLGTALWVIAKLMEVREARSEGNNDRSY